jgi:SNF2-related domain/Helicase conserved C-terminal domain
MQQDKKSKATQKSAKPKKKTKKEDVSYHRRPDHLLLEGWQYRLRLQFGQENAFQVRNLGEHLAFSTFEVINPSTGNRYEVVIRSAEMRYEKMKPNSRTFLNNTCNCQDFKSNRLGICKHISATMAAIKKIRGAKKALREPYWATLSTIYLDYTDGRSIRLYIGTEQEEKFNDWADQYFDQQGRLLPDQFGHFERIIAEGKAIHPEFSCQRDALDLVLEERDRLRRQQIANERSSLKKGDTYFDQLLKTSLFDYQKQGALFAFKAGRALLADEMGLGKTVQAIAAAEMYRRELNLQKVLIVCPTSLKYQWKTEIQKFTESSVHIIEGHALKRKEQYEQSTAFYNIVSYHTVLYDGEKANRLQADLVILDEAQRVKNFRTKVAAQLKKVQSPYILVLTGTPLENKIEELYSIVQFIDQYKLPPLYRFLSRYQIMGDNQRVKGFQHLKEIAALLQDCMLRRAKKDVLQQLPKRIDKVLFVPMTKEQSAMHREYGDQVAQLVAKWHKFHFLSESDRKRLILFLGMMRMVCDSTFIVDQKSRFDTKIDELMCILEEALADPEQKVVVFSQWERMTRLVAQECTERGIGFTNLHGGVPGHERGELLERFSNDPECRIFLSTDAGGVGLNLQRASLLINLDIPWNPAVLEQRNARIYRIGQENPVSVINMVSANTIEHRMLGVLAFKSEMAKGILDPEGDDSIVMSESRFNQFMNNVEEMTNGVQVGESQDTDNAPEMAPAAFDRFEPTEVGDDDLENLIVTEQISTAPTASEPIRKPSSNPAQPATPNPQSIPGDDDTSEPSPAATTPAQAAPATRPAPAAIPAEPAALIQTGVSFLSGLAVTLSNPDKTRELVQNLVEKDEVSGQTYLKIPVADAQVVEQALKVLGSLFAAR